MEDYSEELFLKLGLPAYWPQTNFSSSKRGVIRGMHFQTKKPQGKLIHCLAGTIQDVAIDMRMGSATRGKTYAALLYSHLPNAMLFYVPPGFAHGFLSLDDSLVAYKCTELYSSESDAGVNPLCSGIRWMVEREAGRGISAKDNALPSLMDYLARPE